MTEIDATAPYSPFSDDYVRIFDLLELSPVQVEALSIDLHQGYGTHGLDESVEEWPALALSADICKLPARNYGHAKQVIERLAISLDEQTRASAAAAMGYLLLAADAANVSSREFQALTDTLADLVSDRGAGGDIYDLAYSSVDKIRGESTFSLRAMGQVAESLASRLLVGDPVDRVPVYDYCDYTL